MLLVVAKLGELDLTTKLEQIISGRREPIPDFMPDVALRMLASAECGAREITTVTATFGPKKSLGYHTHPCSEAITVLRGEALFRVEGRAYRLHPLDCIHVPANTAHNPTNASDRDPLIVLSSFASPSPDRVLVEDNFFDQDLGNNNPASTNPEHICRFWKAEKYELGPGTDFFDLFAGRYGAMGFCGGYGKFASGTSLPCRVLDHDESITIVEGTAICEVAGKRYELSGCDTAFLPQGRPHRFLNESRNPMAMIWVYAGSEPSRSIVDAQRCSDEFPARTSRA